MVVDTDQDHVLESHARVLSQAPNAPRVVKQSGYWSHRFEIAVARAGPRGVEPGAVAHDVVVVGAGSAGCVVAARLAEDAGRDLLLIEAGPDYATIDELPREIADGWNLPLTHDWGYRSEPDADGRSLELLRGRIVGGSSAVNATCALRGAAADYDRWGALGNDGWSFDEVLPFFVRLENDRDFGTEPWHGRKGPLPIRRYAGDELSSESDITSWSVVLDPRLRGEGSRGSREDSRAASVSRSSQLGSRDGEG